jgi:hypothetical protein
VKAFEKGEHELGESLLHRFEEQVAKKIEIISESENYSRIQVDEFLPAYDPKEIDPLFLKLQLIHLYLQLNKQTKALPLLDEIKQYLDLKTPLKGVGGASLHVGVGYLPLALYRKYAYFKVQSHYNNAEIQELINYTEKYDSNGLPVLGMHLLEKGDISTAKQIVEIITKPEKNVDSYQWQQFTQEKGRVLRRLEDYEKANKLLTPKEEHSLKPFTHLDSMTGEVFMNLLYLGDIKAIHKELDTMMKNRFDFPYTQFLLNFITDDDPPKGVKQAIWLHTKNYLENRLLEGLNYCNSDQTVKPIYFKYMIINLQLLIKFDRIEEVKQLALRILASIQEIIEKDAPEEIIENIKILPLSQNPLKSDIFVDNLYRDKAKIQFFMVKNDYLTAYKSSGGEPILTIGQLVTVTKKWTHSRGKDNWKWLLNIPYMYESLIGIFTRLEEDKLAILCKNNCIMFHSLRMKAIQGEKTKEILDPNLSGNFLNYLKQDMRIYMKNRNYKDAKEILTIASEMITSIGVDRGSQGNEPIMTFLEILGLLSL